MDSAHKKKQKPLSLILLICVVLLVVIATGLFLIQGTTQSPMAKKSSMGKTCLYDTYVCTYLANFTQTNTFYSGPITATISLEQQKNEHGEVVLQSDSKNNVYALLSQNGKTQGEILMIDDMLYKKNAQGVWQKQQNLENDTITQFRVKAFQQANKSGKGVTYTYIDTQPCGTYTCRQYELKMPTLGKTKVFIVFDTKDYILRKIMQQTPDGNSTQTIFAYNPIMITPPQLQ